MSVTVALCCFMLFCVVLGVTYSRYSATVYVFDGTLMICLWYTVRVGWGGVGWGGGANNVQAYFYTHVMLRYCTFLVHLHTRHAIILHVSLALPHTRHATLLLVSLALPHTRHATLLHVRSSCTWTHTRHATLLHVPLALPHTHVMLRYCTFLLHLHTHVMLRYCTFLLHLHIHVMLRYCLFLLHLHTPTSCYKGAHKS